MKQEWPSITKHDEKHGGVERERPSAPPEPLHRRLHHPDAENANWDAAEKQGEPGQEPVRTPH